MTDLILWFKAHLYWFTIIGGLVLVSSFVQFTKPNWWLFVPSLLLLALVAIGAYSAINSPPTTGPVVDEKPDRPITVPQLPLVQRLQEPWDSEGPANWPVAETMALISQYAYLSPIEARDKLRELGFADCMPFVISSMIGYIISVEDRTVIVFRGTDFTEIADWLANIQRTPLRLEQGEIHAGFYNSYVSLKPQILQILAERKTKHLWVTGHSLGGALAVACAYDLVESQKFELDGLITFGQPMLAKRDLADYLDSQLLSRYARFVKNDDMVPRVPPSYVDCGSLVWFRPEGIKRSPPKATPTTTAPNSLESLARTGDDTAELLPMSEAEFEALQATLRAQGQPSQTADGRVTAQSRRLYIEDHSMTGYVHEVRSMLGIPTQP